MTRPKHYLPENAGGEQRDATPTRDYIFAHTVSQGRSGNDGFVEKLLGKDRRHINSTLIAPGVNIYGNTDWRGFPSVFLRNPIFLAGYPTDIGSDGYFKSERGKKEIPSPAMRMADITLRNKESLGHSYAWGDFTERFMAAKIDEISARIADPKTDFSSEIYFDKKGTKITTSTKPKYTSDDYRKFRSQTIATREQRHNECHVLGGLQHVHCVAITKEFFEKNQLDIAEVSDTMVVASRPVAILTANDLLQKINAEKTNEISSKLDHMVELEIQRSQNVLEKLFLTKEFLKELGTGTTPQSNELMALAFKSKAKKFPDFDPNNPKNHSIWLDSNKAYFTAMRADLMQEFEALQAELKSDATLVLVALGNPNLTYEEFFTKLTEWRNSISTETKSEIKARLATKLQDPIKLRIYDKTTGNLMDFSPTQEDVALNPNDPSTFFQLAANDLFSTPEAKALLEKVTPEQKKLMLEFSLKVTGNRAQHIAAKHGSTESLQCLRELGFDLNFRNNFGDTPLTLAAINGHKNVVEFLEQQHGIQPDIKTLNAAIESGKIELVEFLLAKERIVTAAKSVNHRHTVVHAAAEYMIRNGGDESMIKLLYENCFNMNASNESGIKPMHLAAILGEKSKDALKKYFGFVCDESRRSPLVQMIEAQQSTSAISTFRSASIYDMLYDYRFSSDPEVFFDLISVVKNRNEDLSQMDFYGKNIIEFLVDRKMDRTLQALEKAITNPITKEQKEMADYMKGVAEKLFQADPGFVEKLPDGNSRNFLKQFAETLRASPQNPQAQSFTTQQVQKTK